MNAGISKRRRIVAQFSCGAASAVAVKLARSDWRRNYLVIVNAFIVEEHADNRRFLADCERWFDQEIVVLRDKKYGASTLECWRRKQYIKGPNGAPCSSELKRQLLNSFLEEDDELLVGFTAEECDRLDDLRERLPNRNIHAPLVERGLKKADCFALVQNAGIQIPEMYRLGFHNANCIGCPKGGAGYWNKIRQVFPERFYQIADLQESIGPGAKFLRNRRTNERIYLRELDPSHGRIDDEPAISCSFFCEMAQQDINLEPEVPA